MITLYDCKLGNLKQITKDITSLQSMQKKLFNTYYDWNELYVFAEKNGFSKSTVTRLKNAFLNNNLADFEGVYLGNICKPVVWDLPNRLPSGAIGKGLLGFGNAGAACKRLLESWVLYLASRVSERQMIGNGRFDIEFTKLKPLPLW